MDRPNGPERRNDGTFNDGNGGGMEKFPHSDQGGNPERQSVPEVRPIVDLGTARGQYLEMREFYKTLYKVSNEYNVPARYDAGVMAEVLTRKLNQGRPAASQETVAEIITRYGIVRHNEPVENRVLSLDQESGIPSSLAPYVAAIDPNAEVTVVQRSDGPFPTSHDVEEGRNLAVHLSDLGGGTRFKARVRSEILQARDTNPRDPSTGFDAIIFESPPAETADNRIWAHSEKEPPRGISKVEARVADLVRLLNEEGVLVFSGTQDSQSGTGPYIDAAVRALEGNPNYHLKLYYTSSFDVSNQEGMPREEDFNAIGLAVWRVKPKEAKVQPTRATQEEFRRRLTTDNLPRMVRPYAPGRSEHPSPAPHPGYHAARRRREERSARG